MLGVPSLVLPFVLLENLFSANVLPRSGWYPKDMQYHVTDGVTSLSITLNDGSSKSFKVKDGQVNAHSTRWATAFDKLGYTPVEETTVETTPEVTDTPTTPSETTE